MIYTEAVDYIHSLLKFGIRPGLYGMDALLRLLGNPHKGLRFVHVAGTNGKGSTSTAISNVFIDAGYNVGLYTSPYVCHFLERIQYNGNPVNKEVFSKAVSVVKSAVESLEDDGVVITEFEALTATAFLCFKELSCDVIVLEVGLGGRLDATNIIDTPLVNVITSLSVDHSAVLGNTIGEIAYEKCGTIKNGSNVICSYGQPEEALSVVEKTCLNKNALLYIPDESKVTVLKSDIFGTKFLYKNQEYFIKMAGVHQVKNMTCVIEAFNCLCKDFIITDENIVNGILKTSLPARVEILSENPLVILDGGHNSDGAKAFYNAVKDVFGNGKDILVLAGMMADKEVEKSLKPLIEKCNEFVAVTPQNPRAMSGEELSIIATNYCNKVSFFDSAVKGVDYCFSKLNPNSVLFVVGSLYLAGETRQHIIDLINLQNNN